jgi:hypothetical protein
MQNSAAMNSDVKALLTLLLLKTGTNSPEIHNALQLAAASRVMMAEEYAGPSRSAVADTTPHNVAKLRPTAGMSDAAAASARKMKQNSEAMNSDIKALLTLLLLKNGADANEIQTALRMAAASRAAMAEEQAEAYRVETLAESAATSGADIASVTARQVVRNEQLGKRRPAPHLSTDVLTCDLSVLSNRQA